MPPPTERAEFIWSSLCRQGLETLLQNAVLPSIGQGKADRPRQISGREAEIYVSHPLGYLIGADIGAVQEEAGLVSLLKSCQLFEGTLRLLFDVGAEVVGVETEVLGHRLEGSGQISFFMYSRICTTWLASLLRAEKS